MIILIDIVVMCGIISGIMGIITTGMDVRLDLINRYDEWKERRSK